MKNVPRTLTISFIVFLFLGCSISPQHETQLKEFSVKLPSDSNLPLTGIVRITSESTGTLVEIALHEFPNEAATSSISRTPCNHQTRETTTQLQQLNKGKSSTLTNLDFDALHNGEYYLSISNDQNLYCTQIVPVEPISPISPAFMPSPPPLPNGFH